MHRLRLLLLCTSTCNDKLSGSLSSSSSPSKSADNLKASETLSLNLNLCGLITLVAPTRSSSSCDSCNDGMLSSRKNLQRALQKNYCFCRRLYPSSIALDMRCSHFYKPLTIQVYMRLPSVMSHYTTTVITCYRS